MVHEEPGLAARGLGRNLLKNGTRPRTPEGLRGFSQTRLCGCIDSETGRRAFPTLPLRLLAAPDLDQGREARHMLNRPLDRLMNSHTSPDRPRGLSRRPADLLAAVAVAAISLWPLAPAAAQGTDGSFPNPRGGAEVDAWLDDAGVPEEGRDAIFVIHARYLDEVERLRDSEIEAWVRAKSIAWDPGSIELMEANVRQSLARIEQQRRLLARLDALEDRLWGEIASAAEVPDEVLRSLRERATLRRLSDLAGGVIMVYEGGMPVADVAALAAAAKATPAEAARIRQALAGHDAAMATLLAEARELTLERESQQALFQLRQAESWAETERLVQAEIAAATAENRPAEVQEIYAAHNAEVDRLDEFLQRQSGIQARLIRLNLDAVRAIEPIVGDPLRTARVLSAAGVGNDGMDEFFQMFETMGMEGELSPAKVDAVAELKARTVAANLPQRLELAELEARRQEIPDGGWSLLADGTYVQSPEGEEIDRRMMELQGSASQQQQMQIVIEIGRVIGSKTFAQAMRKWGRMQGMPEQMLEPMIAQLVAGIEAGAIDAEAMQIEFMRRMWSAPPSWKVIDEAMLEAILDDLAVEGELRLVASQLIEDGAPRFAAAIEETAAELALAEDLDPEAMMWIREMGGGGKQAAAIDAGLRRVLAADDAFFDDLEGVLGEQVADRLRPWRAVRRSQLTAATDTGSGTFVYFWMDPSLGRFGSVDLFVIAQRSIPEALEVESVRAAFAAQAERVADLWSDRRRTMSAILREQAEEAATQMALQAAAQSNFEDDLPMDEADMQRMEEGQSRLQELSRQSTSSAKAIPEAVYEDVSRLQALLDVESAKAFRRAVFLEVWGRTVGDLKAGRAIEAARRKAERAGDAARLAELDAIEASYDDATGRLLELLWRTSQEIRAAGTPDKSMFERAGGAVDVLSLWPSASGRVKFRLGEVDFATLRGLGEE